jgi:hypothetical protein
VQLRTVARNAGRYRWISGTSHGIGVPSQVKWGRRVTSVSANSGQNAR